MSISRALEAAELLAAFEPLNLDDEVTRVGARQWEVLRNGELHIAETGEASVDLAAGLFAWRRLAPSPPT